LLVGHKLQVLLLGSGGSCFGPKILDQNAIVLSVWFIWYFV